MGGAVAKEMGSVLQGFEAKREGGPLATEAEVRAGFSISVVQVLGPGGGPINWATSTKHLSVGPECGAEARS